MVRKKQNEMKSCWGDCEVMGGAFANVDEMKREGDMKDERWAYPRSFLFLFTKGSTDIVREGGRSP